MTFDMDMGETEVKVNIAVAQRVTVGDYFAQVKNSKLYQNVQISCSNGRLLENQMIVGLVFYYFLKDVKFMLSSDCVLILPEYTLEEINGLFSVIYSQDFHTAPQQNGNTDEFLNVNDKIAGEENQSSEEESSKDVVSDYFIKSEEGAKAGTPYECDDCPYSSTIYNKFLGHKRNNYMCGLRSEKCLFCKKISKSYESCRKHMERKHPDEWTIFKKENKLKRNQAVLNAKTEDNHLIEGGLYCDQCNYVSIRNEDLKKHVQKKHLADGDNIPYFICKYCTFKTKTYKSFSRHKKNQQHCTPKTVECLFCEKKSISKEASRKHMERNHREKLDQNRSGKLKNN